MPSKSKKQARFMAAAAHNPKFAKKVGMEQSVAKDFNRADAGTGILKKAKGGKVSSILSRMKEHPLWDELDRSDLKRKGYTDEEILKFWDRDLQQERTNTINSGIESAKANAEAFDNNRKAKGGRVAAMRQSPLDLAAGPDMSMAGRTRPTAGGNRPRTPKPGGFSGLMSDTGRTSRMAADKLSRTMSKYAEGGKVGIVARAAKRTATSERIHKNASRAIEMASQGHDADSIRNELGDEARYINVDKVVSDYMPTNDYADGGKVGVAKTALTRLQRLADQFNAALQAQDNESVTRIARQLDAVQPGTSRKLLSDAANAGAGDKLATFAKGGKVAAARKVMKHTMELMSGPEFSVHDDLDDLLSDAGVSPADRKKVSIKRLTKVDDDGENGFHAAEIEGPSEHIQKLKDFADGRNF